MSPAAAVPSTRVCRKLRGRIKRGGAHPPPHYAPAGRWRRTRYAPRLGSDRSKGGRGQLVRWRRSNTSPLRIRCRSHRRCGVAAHSFTRTFGRSGMSRRRGARAARARVRPTLQGWFVPQVLRGFSSGSRARLVHAKLCLCVSCDNTDISPRVHWTLPKLSNAT